VDQDLESVRNAEKAPKPRNWEAWGKWLPTIGKTPKGKKPQGRQSVLKESFPSAGGSRVIRLWRGVKGYERVFRGTEHFPETRQREDLKGYP
jgi:hypothetical protein